MSELKPLSQTTRQSVWPDAPLAVPPDPRWTPQEVWAWERIARGNIANMAEYAPPGTAGVPATPDPKNPASFADHHVLREEFLRAVIFHEPWASGAERQQVKIAHARISGPINWSGRTARGDLLVSNSLFAGGDIRWIGLSVEGSLYLDGCMVVGRLYADGLQISGSIFWGNGFTAKDTVRLVGAHIGFAADFEGATIEGGLNADGLQTGGPVFCRGKFSADGSVRLMGAKISSDADFNGAAIQGGLHADGLQTGGNLFCRTGFRADGGVHLVGAKIDGDAEFDGATLGGALEADRLQTGGDLFCRDGFSAVGDVRLLGAEIRGGAVFNGATLGGTLEADRLQTGGGLSCREGFSAVGDVRLLGAKIGGDAAFDGATLGGKLRADGLQTGGSVFCRGEFSAKGDVLLRGAKIGGDVQFTAATLTGRVDLTGAQITGALELAQRPGTEPDWEDGARLILRNAEVGALAGGMAAFRRIRNGAPAQAKDFPGLDLGGLTYSQLGGVQATEDNTLAGAAKEDLVALLRAATEAGEPKAFTPQPYRQMARVLKQSGHEDKARHILHAMGRHKIRTASGGHKWLLRLDDALTGFGQRNHQALWWFVRTVLAGLALGLLASGTTTFSLTGEGVVTVFRWLWFAFGNAIPLIALDKAHETFLADELGVAPADVPLQVASIFYVSKVVGFGLVSYWVASLAGVIGRGKD